MRDDPSAWQRPSSSDVPVVQTLHDEGLQPDLGYRQGGRPVCCTPNDLLSRVDGQYLANFVRRPDVPLIIDVSAE
jgi:hypothetical protein